MRKIFFTLIGVLLLSTTAFGSDRVLFKMVMTNTSNQSVDAQTAQDLSDYAFFIGGSAEIYNGHASDAKDIILTNSSVGYSRLINTNSYLHVSLDRALQTGDVISYTSGDGLSLNHDRMLITLSSSEVRTGNIQTQIGTPYTVTGSSALKGATDLYFWIGKEMPSSSYTAWIHSLTITTTSNEVVYYDFEDETAAFLSIGANNFSNGLVGYSAAENSNKIAEKSQCGFTKMFYTVGDGADRSLKLNVTDPCTVEVWGIGSLADRKMHITDNTSSMKKWELVTFTDNSSLIKGSYHFEGTDNSTDLYISSSTGSMYIAAVRVIYDRIRPAADLTADVLTTVLQKRNNITITASSSSDQTITRSNVSGQDLVNVTGATGTTYTVAAKSPSVNPNLGTYVMRLSQPASAYYRASSIDISIRIVNEGESVSDVAWNSSYVSTTSYVWKNNENVTLIQNTNDTKFDNNHEAIGEFAAGTGLRLGAGREYTLSVPSNKQIARVTFSGYTAQTGTGSIKVNGVASAFNAYDAENPVIKDIVYEDINAQSFTFEAYNRNIIVKIDLVTTDLGYYPITFGSNWASFCAPEDVELPEGVYAYIASSNDAETITVNKVDGNLVPANTGVLLYSETLPACHVTATTGAPALDGNILQYTTARTARPASGSTYALNGDEGCFQQYTGNYIPANKAYVHIPAAEPSSAPKRLRLVVEGTNTATGMEAISGQSVISRKVVEDGQLVIIRDGVKYNVQGQIIK